MTTLVSARPASASDASSTWAAQPAAGGAGLLALASMTLGIVLVPRHRRARLVRLIALALLVVVAGFEGAIHSVHHLDDPSNSDRCLAAASAEHVSAAGIAGPPISISIAPALERALAASPAVACGAAPAAVAGRSPPA
jgi:hypothetical protein